ncbi:MAG: hypothetical protein U9N32_07655, partial [Spirochaetota bacterium]|nr:hypothetical protein [Spirochaetota bacterium]
MTPKVNFFLNESIPDFDVESYSQLLEKCIKEYIVKISEDGIFHTKGKNHDWSKDLDNFKDKTVMMRAYRLLTTQEEYPIDEEILLNFPSSTSVNGYRFDNPFGHIAAHISGDFLFTTPIVNELEKNTLPLIQTDENKHQVHNYYGDNTQYVLDELKKRHISSLSNLELLKETLPAKWTDMFKRSFNKRTSSQQEAIKSIFFKAKENNFIAQDKGGFMREVTTKKGMNKLYELKIFNPTALRVYFTLKGSVVWIDSLGFKSKQKEDIEKAQKNIDKE